MLQQLDAVLAAWDGEAGPLAALLPERPIFLTDLDPPGVWADDPATLREQLAALARGDWRAVLDAPHNGADAAASAGAFRAGARAEAARAIAHERAGHAEAAIASWDRVLAAGEDERARLARGSLLARAGRRDAARGDFARAGDSFAARWDRAALIVLAAAEGADAPDGALLARARAEAGEPSAFWSDPTVGRLLWSRLVERTLAADGPRPPSEADRARLRSAERALEHDTFWDRALLLVGWARVGAMEEAARVAGPLARATAGALKAEPALAGPALEAVATAVEAAIEAIDALEPARGRRALAGALEREDLRRFRLPCARCGRGSIGVDEVRELFPDEA